MLNLPALTLNPRATVTEKRCHEWTGGTMPNTVRGDDTDIQRTKLSVFRHQSTDSAKSKVHEQSGH